MRAILIAAGSGIRLGNITKNLPKPLVDINGKSIIEREITLLKKNGINDIVIIIGPHKEKFLFKNCKYVFDSFYDNHDQLGSLMAAKAKIKGDLIIFFADILFDNSILQQILNVKADIAVAIDLDWEKSYLERSDNPPSEADKVLIENGKILKISKNIKKNSGRTVGEFLGIVKLSPYGSNYLIKKYEELQKIHLGRFHDAISLDNAKLIDILQDIIESGLNIVPVIIKGKWCEIDTLKDLERAKKIFN